jgi:hypothetical protein
VARVTIELNGDGIRDLLKSDGVQQMLVDRAEQVAEHARGRGVRVEGEPGDEPLPIRVEAGTRGRTRARAFVIVDHDAALAVEAKHRLLVGSLDAAR